MKSKFLFYRLSSMGDIVLTTPLLRVLRKNFPDVEIHYITREQYADILRYNPNIDHLWTVEKNPLKNLELRSLKFDYFIDLHRNWRSKTFAFCFSSASYSTFPKLNIKKLLLTRFKINFLPQQHIVERYFKALRKLNLSYDGEGLDFYLPPSFHIDIDFKPFIAVVLGGTYYTKKYPTYLWLEVIDHLTQPVVLLGGRAEEVEGIFLTKNSKNKVFNFCGKLSIAESAYYIKESTVVISHDTGLMHIAAAFKKPLISIWGNTVPAFGMYPLFPKTYQSQSIIVETKNLSCRPCSKLGYHRCPKGHFKCMENISPMRIVSAVSNLI
ncbi:MAG: glycosyltransferase family 9 protein [Bacteroidales bacterium]|nr:glycosyltransferase family 9 protein [Bacteroidales bacterium]